MFSEGFAEYTPGRAGEPGSQQSGASPSLERLWRPEADRFFRAQAGQAFDRTLGVRAWENVSIWREERAARNEGKLRVFEDEAAFAASPDYRPGIEFDKGMNATRLKILAENYDRRRSEEAVIQAGYDNGPWWYAPLGFGAGMIGSLPDPVNVIPFGGQAVAGAKLAGMTTRQIVGRSLTRGFAEGAGANFVSSGIAAFDLGGKGEDLGMQDVLLDTMFGGVAGPIFHGAGAFGGRAKARKGMRRNLELLDEQKASRDSGLFLKAMIRGMERGETAAFRLTEGLHNDAGFREGLGRLRTELTPKDRKDIARSMEKALLDLCEGRHVDVGTVLADSPTISKMEVAKFLEEIRKDIPSDVDFGTLKQTYFDAVNVLRHEKGYMPLRDRNMSIPAGVLVKFKKNRMEENHLEPEQLAAMLTHVFHKQVDAFASSHNAHIQGLIKKEGKKFFLGFLSDNPKTGGTVIKSLYRLSKKSLDTAVELESSSMKPKNMPRDYGRIVK